MINVTITGADDCTDPSDLLRLIEEFPFVEWGILRSAKQQGGPRYPSNEWITIACAIFDRTPLAFHACGRYARDMMDGGNSLHVQHCRVQINGYQPGRWEHIAELSDFYPIDFILQCRSEDTLQECANDAKRIPGASVLFDLSGGRGVEPMRWPPTPCGCKLGFAGGIGPDNVLQVIGDIGPRDPYWIDMESGVRTDDRLDLVKVRRVLEQVAELNAAGESR